MLYSRHREEYESRPASDTSQLPASRLHRMWLGPNNRPRLKAMSEVVRTQNGNAKNSSGAPIQQDIVANPMNAATPAPSAFLPRMIICGFIAFIANMRFCGRLP